MENNNYTEAIKEIANMAHKAQTADLREINGRHYLVANDGAGNPQYIEIVKKDDTAYPDRMRVNTLSAFINYILAGIENGEITDKLYINVLSPTTVVAQSPVNEYGRRKEIAVADRYNLRSFTFGQYNSFESFVVALQSQFIPTEETKNLLNNLKSMTQSNELKTEDNGISQTVVAKQGATLGAIQVSPIWKLSPFRTFTEIEQPDSLFLLRLRQGGESSEFALHETDGGAWAIKAMEEIKEFLSSKLINEKTAGRIFVL